MISLSLPRFRKILNSLPSSSKIFCMHCLNFLSFSFYVHQWSLLVLIDVHLIDVSILVFHSVINTFGT